MTNAPREAAGRPSGTRSESTKAAIVFADVEHYSSMVREVRDGDSKLVDFFTRIHQVMATIRKDSRPIKGAVVKSAGDGFMLVYPVRDGKGPDVVRIALEHAFALRKFFLDDRESSSSLWLHVRVALHFGDVTLVRDPLTAGRDAVGRNVIEGARLEPKTLPDMVWATRDFEREAEHHNLDGYRFQYVGQVPLAKNWGNAPVYQVVENGPWDSVYVRQYPKGEEAVVGIHVEQEISSITKLHIVWGASHCDVDIPKVKSLARPNLRRELVLEHRLFKAIDDLPLLRVFVKPPSIVSFVPFTGDSNYERGQGPLMKYVGRSRFLIRDEELDWYAIPDMAQTAS